MNRVVRGHYARALAHVKREPEATSSAAPVASETPNYAQRIVASVPKSTIALAVVISVLGVVILSVCIIWKIRVRRKSRNNGLPGLWTPSTPGSGFGDSEKSAGLDSLDSAGIEKPVKVILADSYPHTGEGGWVPQIRNYRGVPLKNGELPAHVQAAREGRKWVPPIDVPKDSAERSPPPSYVTANAGPKIPLPPVPADSNELPPTPPTPPASQKLQVPTSFPPSRFSNDTPLSISAEPLPSPARSSSFAHQQRPVSSGKHLSVVISRMSIGIGSEPLPRLMTVINTFTPSLDDELRINISDTVRMLEEYHDGWCLVQHVGKPDSLRGVVPRFCLVERQNVKASRSRSLTKSIKR